MKPSWLLSATAISVSQLLPPLIYNPILEETISNLCSDFFYICPLGMMGQPVKIY